MTASLTATGAESGRLPPSPVAGRTPASRSSAIDSPSMTRAAALASGVAVALETNGTVRDARGLASSTKSDVGRQRELDVDEPAHADALGDRLGRLADALDLLATERDGRQGARRVAGVHAGLLDVLHDAAEEQLGAVVERVDVDLDRVVEEAVDEHRVLRRDLGGAPDVVLQRRLVVDDLHAAAAQHVRRAHQHRVADLVGDRAWRASNVVAMPCLGDGRPASASTLPERAALLGEVDRGGRGADDRHAGRLETRRRARAASARRAGR